MITTDFNLLEAHKCDVCVVGSGPVGLCLALDLAHRGLYVLILESGLAKPDERLNSLGDALITSPQYHHPMSVAVNRSLGGTSELWGGRCMPLDEIDFIKRSYMPNSGWPIVYDDVARYERRAAELIGCDDGGFTVDDFGDNCQSELNFSNLERWLNEPRIIRHHPELRLSGRIAVLTNATVVGLDIQAGTRTIKGLRVARKGQTARFNGADAYVLALGGIETARLLLNVQIEHPLLFGGPSGALGRYYMGHVSGSFSEIQFYSSTQARKFGNSRGKRSFDRRRITITAKTQLNNQIPNVAFWPENAALSDANHKAGFLSFAFLLMRLRATPLAEAIRIMHTKKRVPIIPHLRNIMNDLGGVIVGSKLVVQQRCLYGRRLPRLFLIVPSGRYPLHFHSEQAPNRANCVRLIDDCDWLGMRRAAVDFTFTPQELVLVAKAHQVLDRSIRALGVGELIYRNAVDDEEAWLREVAADGLHQIGTTRMSNDPATGVVDRNCRVFDFDNVYVAGSSIFPTSGQASPTLPAVALAMRLSEALAGRVAQARPDSPPAQAARMSILFVTASYYPAVRFGGPTYTVHALARTLAERGHRVVVYTTNVGVESIADPNKVYTNIIDGVTVRYFPSSVTKIYWSSQMIRELRENVGQFDVVHAQGAFLYPTVAARRASSRLGIPFAYSPRGMLVETLVKKKNFLGKLAWIEAFEIKNCKEAAFLHATSNIEAQEIKRLGMRPKSIEVIPNGLDLPEEESEESAAARRKRLIGQQGPYLIILGRVSWKKGIDRLIRAMSFVPSINLVIAGNDEENYTPKLIDLARQRGLENRIIFCGAVYGMDKFALLQGAELFVLPSYSESFGVVLLEALCCGCPVIMTPEVGIAKDLEKLGAGVITRSDPEKIGATINALLGDPERRRRISEVGRTIVRDRYSWEGIASGMEAAYRRALREHRVNK